MSLFSNVLGISTPDSAPSTTSSLKEDQMAILPSFDRVRKSVAKRNLVSAGSSPSASPSSSPSAKNTLPDSPSAALSETVPHEDLLSTASEQATSDISSPEKSNPPDPVESLKDLSTLAALSVDDSSTSPTQPLSPQPISTNSTPSDILPISIDSQQQQAIQVDESQITESSKDYDCLQSAQTKIDELQHVVALREQSVLNAMVENAGLNESIAVLKDQLREASAKQTTQPKTEKLERLLLEKEDQIKGLLAEASTTIKKLRTQISEQDVTLKDLTAKYDAALIETTDLKARLAKLGDVEKSMKAVVEQCDAHVKTTARLEIELGKAREESGAKDTTLERAWAQVSELKKSIAEASSVATSDALEKEIKRSEELGGQVGALRVEHETVVSGLRKEIFELRSSLTRLEEESGWKEDALRKEINSLQIQRQAAEARNEELSSSSQDSSKPLLRQIELLQNQHNASLTSWEQMEQ
ncbi:TATA element modulatory factor 1, partial [Nowakowskiella sp. JEL0078]